MQLSRDAAHPRATARSLQGDCQKLIATIHEFERSWAMGPEFLREVLFRADTQETIGEEILDAYQLLIDRQHASNELFRRQFIRHLLDYPRAILAEDKRGYALVPETSRARGVVEISGGTTQVEGLGEIHLRQHQLLVAPIWRIDLRIEDEALADAYAAMLLGHVQRMISRQLRGLQRLESELHHEFQQRRFNFENGGFHFEQLMLDVLNESSDIARRASLHEDFIEKTDLRYRIKKLKRRRGARIQVTSTIDQQRHSEKLDSIRRANELVILSPLTLAMAIQEKREELVYRVDYDGFWSAVGRAATVEDLAYKIREICFSAIHRSNEDPRGPAALIPDPVRGLIQRYVEVEALRSTSEMRAREERQRSRGERFGPR